MRLTLGLLTVLLAAPLAPFSSLPVARAASSPIVAPLPAPQDAPFDSIRTLLRAARFRDAILVATKLVQNIEVSPELDSMRLARALDLETESMLQQGRGRSEDAIRAAERAVEIKSRIAIADSTELGISLGNLSSVREAEGDCREAARLSELAVGIHLRAGEAAGIALAHSLVARANARELCGDSQGMESDLRRAIAISELRLGKGNPLAANCMDHIGLRRMAIGDCREARSFIAEASRIRKAVLPAGHPDLAVSKMSEAWLKAEYEDELKARGAIDEAAAEIESLLGPHHPLVAEALLQAGVARGLLGDVQGACDEIGRAFRIALSVYGQEHPRLAAFVRNEAIALNAVGEADSALTLLRAAVRSIERVGNPDHPSFIQVLPPYSDQLMQAGLRQEGLEQTRRAVAIAEHAYGSDSPRLAPVLMTLVGQEREGGDLLAALAVAQRFLELVEGNPCATYSERVGAYEALGDVLASLGEYEQAENWIEKANATAWESQGAFDIGATKRLASLARLRRALGDLEGARSLLHEALAQMEEAGAQRSSKAVRLLFDLAEIHLDLGDYTAAQSVYDRAIQLYLGSVLGEKHPAAKIGITNLRSVLHGPEGETAGMPRYRAALSMLEAMVGPYHEAAVMGQQALGRVLLAENEHAAALEALLRADVAARRRFRTAVTGLSERRALRYAQTRRQDLGRILSLVSDSLGSQPDFATRAWDAVIGSRGLVMEAVAARSRTVRAKPDSVVARSEGQLAEARLRLSALWVGGPQAESPAAYNARLRTAADELQRAEVDLAEKSPLFRQELLRGSLGIAEVAAAAPESSAVLGVVRYVHFPSFDAKTDGDRYIAFLLRPGRVEPLRINLGDAGAVDAAVMEWRKAAFSPGDQVNAPDAEATCRQAGARLRALIWDPIAKQIADAQRVFAIPDGALCLVNIAALPSGGGAYLIEEKPTVHLLSSERDLVPSAADSTSGNGLLVLGDPDFNRHGLPVARGPKEAQVPEDDRQWGQASQAALRAPRVECEGFRSLRWGSLPWTSREAKDVVASLSDTIGPGAQAPGRRESTMLLTKREASELNLRELAPGRRLLHLATHGFFLGKGCRGGVYLTRGLGGLAEEAREPVRGGESENPLLLSGLVLAGANRRSPGTPGDNDGILTGEEIAALDLTGVEWAVLSACETGVGEVRAGEGVFGLQRAFRIAGARTVVMSLWSVQDKAAGEWMKALYDARIRGGQATIDAVRSASLWCLLGRRKAGLSTHPFYWGAFVAAGDWR